MGNMGQGEKKRAILAPVISDQNKVEDGRNK